MTIIKLELVNGRRDIQTQSHRTSCWLDGYIEVPSHLERFAWDSEGYCDLVIEDDKLVDIVPTDKPAPDIGLIKEDKLMNISSAGKDAIVAGIDIIVPSTNEEEHFSLEETDQINLSTALVAVEQGASHYPYHADGQLCKLYTADDIRAIANASVAHKLYHTTYCNHLLMWIRRCESVEELDTIYYGADLPEDLRDNLESIISTMSG